MPMKMADMFPVTTPRVGPAAMSDNVLPKNVQPKAGPLTGNRMFTPQIGLNLGIDSHR